MNCSLVFRRLCYFNSTTAALASPKCSTSCSSSKKSPLVFLGSPQVSATVLDALFNASQSPNSIFEVVAIVTQPPARKDRGKKLIPSLVAQYAFDRGFPCDRIFTPERAGEEMFLSNLRALQPELCITTAYGNILPTKFLNIPPMVRRDIATDISVLERMRTKAGEDISQSEGMLNPLMAKRDMTCEEDDDALEVVSKAAISISHVQTAINILLEYCLEGMRISSQDLAFAADAVKELPVSADDSNDNDDDNLPSL